MKPLVTPSPMDSAFMHPWRSTKSWDDFGIPGVFNAQHESGTKGVTVLLSIKTILSDAEIFA